MRAALLIITSLGLAACDGAERRYALPPPPALAEPTTPAAAPMEGLNRPLPGYTQPTSPAWTLMPSQRTGCGRNFC